MNPIFRCAGLLILSLGLTVPTTLAQEKKGDDPKKEGDPVPKLKAKDKLKVKADWSYEVAGKITQLDDKDDKGLEFTIHISLKIPEPNVEGQKQLVQHQQSLLQHQQQLAKAKTVQDRQNALNAIAQDQINIEKARANLIKFKDVEQDLKFKEKTGLRVRFFDMPAEFDVNTGEPIIPTKEEKDKARGAEGYPGFKADKKNLKVGQIVYVFVHKDSKMPDYKKEKANDQKELIENFRPEVIMIYVAVDAPPEKKK